ncbi:5-hydroxytryptamine receptor 7 [Acipenser ruthenus]|uniref:5-hydroxytryptamine receptor 7 n=1 Tax=Acipenser ruthenus TaxID=7906 RepID=A0A444UE31_ACIRT|nr:5-hydroxytryptamine receptor 7 [Acipenser ruthenus]
MVVHANLSLIFNSHLSLGETKDLVHWQGLHPSAAVTGGPFPASPELPTLELQFANGTNSTDCGEEILLYGDVEKVVIGIVLSIITLTTIGGNSLVIISVCTVKKLRQPSNYLVVSLAAADLSVALAVMPFVITTDLVGGEWLFGKFFCNVFIAMDVICCTASIMTLCVISVDRGSEVGDRGNTRDVWRQHSNVWGIRESEVGNMWGNCGCKSKNPGIRPSNRSSGHTGKVFNKNQKCFYPFFRYLGITRPLTYPVWQNGKLMAKMVFIAWLMSASITLPPLFGWATNVTVERVCLISQDFGYTVYSTAVAFYIPMTVMLIMYFRIYKAAKISAEKHMFMYIPQQYNRDGIYSMDQEMRGAQHRHVSRQDRVMEECATLSKLLWPDRRNISIFKREQKAARTLGIIVGAFTFCWLPFFLLSTARPFICGIECSCMPLRLERTLLWLGYTNSLINPLIYAFFNRDLRTTFWNLLRCKYRNINRRLSAASMHEALKAKERP